MKIVKVNKSPVVRWINSRGKLIYSVVTTVNNTVSLYLKVAKRLVNGKRSHHQNSKKKKCYLYEVMDMFGILIVVIILKYIYIYVYILCTYFIICTSSHHTVYFKHIHCHVNCILKLKTYLKTDEKIM